MTPQIGLIAPQSQIEVTVEAKKSEKLTGDTLSKSKIEVKIFRSFCDKPDPAELEKYFQVTSLDLFKICLYKY